MTLFYDEERDALVENHPDEYISREDDGHGGERLVMEFGELRREEKRKALLNIGVSAVKASDEYAVVTEPETEWVGGE